MKKIRLIAGILFVIAFAWQAQALTLEEQIVRGIEETIASQVPEYTGFNPQLTSQQLAELKEWHAKLVETYMAQVGSDKKTAETKVLHEVISYVELASDGFQNPPPDNFMNVKPLYYALLHTLPESVHDEVKQYKKEWDDAYEEYYGTPMPQGNPFNTWKKYHNVCQYYMNQIYAIYKQMSTDPVKYVTCIENEDVFLDPKKEFFLKDEYPHED